MEGSSSRISETEESKTFAFFDLETTGIPELEFFKTKITEISIVACSVEHFLNENDPRVLHKLTLCFNPFKRIDIKSSDITGLTNELLEFENKFDENAMNLLEKFISQLQQPVCLIAHNGEKFDFPLLQKQFEILKKHIPETLKCCDSLKVLKEIDGNNSKVPELDPKVGEVETQECRQKEPQNEEFKERQKLNETTPRKNSSPDKGRDLKDFAKRRLFPERQRNKSFALREIHSRFFNSYPNESHFAEADVLALMKCALKYKNDFVRLVNSHCIKFSDAKGFNEL
jgi:three prime repair exonuclease 1